MADQIAGTGFNAVQKNFWGWLVAGAYYTLGRINFGTGNDPGTDVDDADGKRFPVNPQAAPIVPNSSDALENSHIISTAARKLHGLYATVQTPGYLMTFDSATLPADGPVEPIECLYCPSGPDTYSIDHGETPDAYAAGIVVVFSTGADPFTKLTTQTPETFFKWRIR